MRESTRIYTRMVTNLLVGGVFAHGYLRSGDRFDLILGSCLGALALVWLVRARSAGDALAPPLRNPRAVKRFSIACGTVGGILVLTMLWRAQGDWARLIERGNLWLALGWIILLPLAIFVPIEFRGDVPAARARSRGSR